MKTEKYKILFFLSLVVNILLIALLFKPLPEEEQEMLKFFRDMKKNESTILPESKTNEVKRVSGEILTKISESWDIETFKSYFSDEVINKTGEKKLVDILKMYRTLGKFKETLLPESIETVIGKPNLIIYGTNAKFESGNGYVTLILEKKDNNWRMNRINIKSEVFLNQFE